MNRAPFYAWSVWAAALCAAVALGDELSLGAREGVILLNNGELIAGTIVAAGDRYDVQLKTGEISVRRADVAMVCRDALECYAQKRAGIESDRPQDHLDLAEWCIKNDLLDAAATELAAAKVADAGHPKIRLVESRLALAKEKPQREPAPRPAAKPASQESLDSMARNLPGGTMEYFTNTVQPMLLNYCAKGGCHAGRGLGGLHLERVHPRHSGRFTTQRNLRSVLLLIDRQNPPQSKLLQTPIQPHGPAAAPIFTDREQAQYKQLVAWVFAVAGVRQEAAPPTLAERTAPLLQAVPNASGPPSGDGAAAGGAESLSAQVPPPEKLDAKIIPASSAERAFTRQQIRALGLDPASTSNVQYGADTTGQFVPKDPFDPEIFNRRFFPR